MELRQAEIIRVEVEITEIIMRLQVTRLVFQRSCKTINGSSRISLSRLDDAEVAVGIGCTILLGNCFGIKISGLEVSAFIERQRLLEPAQLVR